jgi:hypothetical protein
MYDELVHACVCMHTYIRIVWTLCKHLCRTVATSQLDCGVVGEAQRFQCNQTALFTTTRPFHQAFPPGLSTRPFHQAFPPGLFTRPFHQAFVSERPRRHRLTADWVLLSVHHDGAL